MPSRENKDLDVEMGITLQRLTKQLAVAEARMVKTARRTEDQFAKNNAAAARSFKRIDEAAARSGRRINGLTGQVAGLRNALIGAFSAREIQQFADSWTVGGNKIAAAGEVAGRAGRSLEEINDIADATRSGFTETVDLYAKLLRTTADVAESEEEVARAVETVNKAFKAGGAAASEQAAGILQLSQGLSSGILQGDELRSVRENAPLLAQAIADEFGVTIGALKELGAEGKITADRVFKGILAAAPDIERAFAQTNATIGEGFTQLRNALTEYIGAGDDSIGATAKITAALGALAKNIDVAVAAGTILGARFIGPVLGRLLGQTLGNVTRAAAALGSLGTSAGIAAGGLAAVRGSLALLGGPVGLVISALTTLPLITENNAERIRALDTAGENAAAALRTYAEASRTAARDQDDLGGKVRVATQEMLAQSRAALQDSLREFRAEYKKTVADIRGEGLFDGSEVREALSVLESFNPMTIPGFESADSQNPFLAGIRAGLRAIDEGAGDIRATATEIERLAGAGEEVFDAVRQLEAANADPLNLSLEEARAKLIAIAEGIGGFDEQLRAVADAEGPEAAAAALEELAASMEQAAQAGRYLRNDGVSGFRELAAVVLSSEKNIEILQEALGATDEEMQALVDRLNDGEGAADRLRAAGGRISFDGAAASAQRLADQLGRAVDNAADLAKGSVADAERARIKLEFADDPIGEARALANAEFDNRVGDYSGADPILRNVLDEERKKHVEGAVAAAEYGEKLDKLNESRRKAGRSGGSGKDDDDPLGDLIDGSDQAITDLERQIELIGRTDAEIAELTLRWQLLDEAKREGLALDQQIGDTGLTLAQTIDAQAAAVGRLTEEYQGAADQAQFVQDMTGQLKSGFIDAIVAGEDFATTLGNVAQQMAKVLLQAALFGEGPLAQLFGQQAGVGLLSFIPGFSDGGYTGPGGKFQPAGLVHKGEYVFDKRSTDLIGPENLEAMRRAARRGYADGGLVGGGAPSVNVEPKVEVVFVNSEEQARQWLNSPRGRDQFRTIAAEEGVSNG